MVYFPKITEATREYHERMFPRYVSDFIRTDPEFIERFDNFAFDEVRNAPGNGGGDLLDRTRFIGYPRSLNALSRIEKATGK